MPRLTWYLPGAEHWTSNIVEHRRTSMASEAIASMVTPTRMPEKMLENGWVAWWVAWFLNSWWSMALNGGVFPPRGNWAFQEPRRERKWTAPRNPCTVLGTCLDNQPVSVAFAHCFADLDLAGTIATLTRVWASTKPVQKAPDQNPLSLLVLFESCALDRLTWVRRHVTSEL